MPKIKKPSFRKAPRKPSSYSPIFTLRTKILIFTGLFLMLIPLVYYINQTLQLMYIVPDVPSLSVQKEASPAAKPTHIMISKVRINLPVLETRISNGTWTIAGDGASHLSESASPGEAGPIILYAHNTNSRFGPIRWLTKGDSIEITTADKKIHPYTISETVQTSPNELSVFFKRKNEALYLFTCDGLGDLKRYIIIAEPVKNASPSARL